MAISATAILHRDLPLASLSSSPSSFSFPSCSDTINSTSPSSLQLPVSHSFLQLHSGFSQRICPKSQRQGLVNCSLKEPLKVMISGAPSSGKGTQCELIVKKFGLVHVSTGDLLRAEVSAGSEIGGKAKEYMENGLLVPDEIVTKILKSRLSQQDVRENGWLLDGYPRNLSQAQSLENMKIRPDICLMLDVPDDILIERCIGRRMDPVTGKIYHLKYFPPEMAEIYDRLIARPDDTEDKVKSRLETYKKNVEAISKTYMDVLHKIDGNHPRDMVFRQIESLLQVQSDKLETRTSDGSRTCILDENASPSMTSARKDKWRGIPTRLNNIPHSREIREYFYEDVLQAIQRALENGRIRLKVENNIPELNPEMDVYRIGTLMELVRTLALSFADDGKRVKVCVQGSMGEGALSGMPLQLAGTRKILEFMDWGEHGALGSFVSIGSIGAKDVNEQDDIFILVSPQNAVGNCIIDDLKAMTDAAGNRPVILVNPRLKDLPSSSGIMQAMGRDKRLKYAASFENGYFFRLLYYAGTQYPIMGALRMSYPYRYELYKRVNEPSGKEKYVIIATFPEKPTSEEINDAFEGKPRNNERSSAGIFGFLKSIF